MEGHCDTSSLEGTIRWYRKVESDRRGYHAPCGSRALKMVHHRQLPNPHHINKGRGQGWLSTPLPCGYAPAVKESSKEENLPTKLRTWTGMLKCKRHQEIIDNLQNLRYIVFWRHRRVRKCFRLALLHLRCSQLAPIANTQNISSWLVGLAYLNLNVSLWNVTSLYKIFISWKYAVLTTLLLLYICIIYNIYIYIFIYIYYIYIYIH